MKKIWKVSLAVIVSFVLAACSTDSGVDTNKQESDSTGYPITIEHAFGETVLDQNQDESQRFHGAIKMCLWLWVLYLLVFQEQTLVLSINRACIPGHKKYLKSWE